MYLIFNDNSTLSLDQWDELYVLSDNCIMIYPLTGTEDDAAPVPYDAVIEINNGLLTIHGGVAAHGVGQVEVRILISKVHTYYQFEIEPRVKREKEFRELLAQCNITIMGEE